MNDLRRRRYIGVCRGPVCVSDLCQVRVFYKSVKLECLTRVSSKKCLTRVSSKGVLQECQVRSVLQECQVRVSYKSVK